MSEPSLHIESLVIDSRRSTKSVNMKSPELTGDSKRSCNPDHYNPTVREVNIPKLANGSCGFDLSRSKWDPYPWVRYFNQCLISDFKGVLTVKHV